MVSSLGMPSLFITFTCNPQWPEIIESLPPNTSADDNFDIVDRVFQLKVKALTDDLYRDGIFGEAVAYVEVIEFQKRGLPHVHLVLWLRRRPTLDEVDEIVCAEIPNVSTHPELHALVSQCMIHTCREGVCLDEFGHCKKHFPMAYCNFTHYDDANQSFVHYRRRSPENGGNTIIVGDEGGSRPPSVITNAFVVPYNPHLSLRYGAHINVLIATSALAIKYLFKYVYKGPDRTMYRIARQSAQATADAGNNANAEQARDEVQEFRDARFMCAHEAAWHMNEFRMYTQSHHITRLPVHLPNRQSALWNNTSISVERAIANSEHTRLTRFFERVALELADPSADAYSPPDGYNEQDSPGPGGAARVGPQVWQLTLLLNMSIEINLQV